MKVHFSVAVAGSTVSVSRPLRQANVMGPKAIMAFMAMTMGAVSSSKLS